MSAIGALRLEGVDLYMPQPCETDLISGRAGKPVSQSQEASDVQRYKTTAEINLNNPQSCVVLQWTTAGVANWPYTNCLTQLRLHYSVGGHTPSSASWA